MAFLRTTPWTAAALIAGALLVTLLWPSQVSAQTVSPGTGFQPIFGGTGQGPLVHEHVDATLTIVAAGDSNVAEAESAGIVTPVTASMPERRGFYTEMNPQFAAGWRTPRLQFNATAASDVRSYGNFNDVLVMSHAGQFNLTGQFGRATTFSINEGVAYAPAFLNGIFALTPASVESTVSSSAANNTFDSEHSYSSGSTLNIAQALTKRTSVSLNADLQYTTYRGGVPGYSDQDFYHAGSSLIHGLGRNTHLQFGYRFGDGQYLGQSSRTTEHNVEIGFDHSRALSATRRSTFAMTLGSSITKGPFFGATAESSISEQYHLTGSVSYSRQVSRTWFVLGTYQRALNYIQGLAQPVFMDSVAASTHGFVTRRTDLSLSASYSAGAAGIAGGSPFSTYAGDMRWRVALSRSLAIYTEYLYYFYDFNGALTRPPNVPSRFARNGVRVGVTAWVPVRQR